MKTTRAQNLLAAALVGAPAFITGIAHAADPLPAWNSGKAKQSITEFVAKVTKPGSPVFVPPAERIAVSDNDGTLWAEQPMCLPQNFKSFPAPSVSSCFDSP